MQTTEFVSGNINSIVLQSLASGDKYGLEICKDVEEKTEGAIVIKQPSLYSALKRLSEQDLVTSYWKDSDIGGKRHYYRLTDAGKYALSDIKASQASRQLHKFFEDEANSAKEEVAVSIIETETPEKEIKSLFEIAVDIPNEKAEEKIKDENSENVLKIEDTAKAEKPIEEISQSFSNVETEIAPNSDIVSKTEDIVSHDGAIVKNENTSPLPAPAKITILRFDDEHNVEKRYEINDATNQEIEDILNQYIPSHATYSVSHEDSTKITKISIPKPDAALLTETVTGNYIYSDISQIRKEEQKREREQIQTTNDAVFLDERLDYNDINSIMNKRNEELARTNFNEKYGSAVNKIYEKTTKLEEETDASLITNYFAPLDAYSVYSYSRYQTKTGSSKLKRNYIDIHKLNLVKQIILFVVAMLEVIGLSIWLGVEGLIDYRSAICLFVVIYPVTAFLIVDIFKFIYNKYKKGKTLSTNSYFFLEILTYLAIFGIIFALNKMFGIQILDNHLVLDALPFASWFLFPAVVFFNIVLSAVVYWILKATNKFYPKEIK